MLNRKKICEQDMVVVEVQVSKDDTHGRATKQMVTFDASCHTGIATAMMTFRGPSAVSGFRCANYQHTSGMCTDIHACLPKDQR